MRSLALRILLLGFAVMASLAAVAAWITVTAATAYHDELLQRMNGSIAMYIDREAPLIRRGNVDEARLDELARRAMTINPIAEVYLLDALGRVVAPRSRGRGEIVDLRAIAQFLAPTRRGPVYGTDPRAPGETRIFSAWTIETDGRPEGYVYVILGGARHDSVAASIAGSYILQAAVGALAVVALIAVGVAWAGTAWQTRPVRALHESIVRMARELLPHEREPAHSTGGDIRAVRAAFDALVSRLRRHIGAMQEVDRLRRELYENASHDLRTPLTSMRGYLETLQMSDSVLAPEKRAHFVSIALRQCNRVERLVEQMLALARVDGPEAAFRPEAMRLAELAQDIVTKFQLRAEQAGIRLELERDPSIGRVIGDVGLLECVIENLVDNALRHTPRGGRVTVRVHAGSGAAIVDIEDTGSGIPAADLARVQSRFETGHGGHVGLGLSIVRRALRLHGCALELSSRRGTGTRARFSLRVADEAGTGAALPGAHARDESVNS